MVAAKKDAVRVLNNPAEIVKIDVVRTTHYELFDFAEDNRPIASRHVLAMKQSFEKYGFLVDCPIHVIRGADGRYKITDGQHRFLAAKELGIPFYFSLKNNPDSVDDIQVMHRYQKAWKLEDYLHHYVKRGVPSYVALKYFAEKYHLPVSNALTILSRSAPNALRASHGNAGSVAHAGMSLRDKFKSGDFTFSKDDADSAVEIMTQVNELRYLHDRFNIFNKERAFVAALYKVVTHPHYDHEYMKEKLSLGAIRLNRCGAIEDYVALLTEIYNYKRRDENRLDFKTIRTI